MNGNKPGPSNISPIAEAAARAICHMVLEQQNYQQQTRDAPPGARIIVRPMPKRFLAEQLDRQWPAFLPHAIAAINAARAAAALLRPDVNVQTAKAAADIAKAVDDAMPLPTVAGTGNA